MQKTLPKDNAHQLGKVVKNNHVASILAGDHVGLTTIKHVLTLKFAKIM